LRTEEVGGGATEIEELIREDEVGGGGATEDAELALPVTAAQNRRAAGMTSPVDLLDMLFIGPSGLSLTRIGSPMTTSPVQASIMQLAPKEKIC